MRNKNQLKYYSLTLFTNLTTSKFFYISPNDIVQIEKIRLHINHFKPNKTHFLYLYFLAKNKLPHTHNFYIPKKFRYQKHRIRRRHGISVFLKNNYYFIFKLLTEILPFYSPTEKEAIKKIKNYWKLTVWQAPLTNETYRLQSLNSYVSLLPLTISFHFQNLKTTEHLHFFDFFKILSHNTITSLIN